MGYLPDGTARATQTYTQWLPTNPEYVPVANYPMFYNGVLYAITSAAAPTGLWLNRPTRNQIVRSVTGAPLNFLIAVTPTVFVCYVEILDLLTQQNQQ